jgi:hypothetical protein
MELRSFKAVVMAQNNGTQILVKNDEVGAEVPESAVLADVTDIPGDGISPAVASPPDVNATLAPEVAPPQAVAGTEASPSPLLASALPQITSDDCPLRINDFSAQALNNQYLRIRYNLSVLDGGSEGRPVAGLTRYAAVLEDGSRVDLTPSNPGSSRFSINYMKPMSSNARLPQGRLTTDVRGVDVFIETADGTVYGQSYAFPSEAP